MRSGSQKRNFRILGHKDMGTKSLEEVREDIRMRLGDFRAEGVVRFGELFVGEKFRTQLPGVGSRVWTKIDDTQGQLPEYEIPPGGIRNFGPMDIVLKESL